MWHKELREHLKQIRPPAIGDLSLRAQTTLSLGGLAAISLTALSLLQSLLVPDSGVPGIHEILFERGGITYSHWPKDLDNRLGEDVKDRLDQARVGLSRLDFLVANIQPRTFDLVVDTDNPFVWRPLQDNWRLGLEIFRAAGHLERLIVKQWLDQSNFSPHLSSMEKWVVTDFILYEFVGLRHIYDPFSQTLVPLGRSPQWPDILLTWEEFCHTRLRPIELLDFCPQSPPPVVPPPDLEWSYFQMFTYLLIQDFRSLALPQQLEWLFRVGQRDFVRPNLSESATEEIPEKFPTAAQNKKLEATPKISTPHFSSLRRKIQLPPRAPAAADPLEAQSRLEAPVDRHVNLVVLFEDQNLYRESKDSFINQASTHQSNLSYFPWPKLTRPFSAASHLPSRAPTNLTAAAPQNWLSYDREVFSLQTMRDIYLPNLAFKIHRLVWISCKSESPPPLWAALTESLIRIGHCPGDPTPELAWLL